MPKEHKIRGSEGGRGNYTPRLIGEDFRFSPIGNHKHPKLKRSAEKGKAFAREYVKHFNAIWAAESSGVRVGENWLSRIGKAQKGSRSSKGLCFNPKVRYAYFIEEEMKKMSKLAEQKGITPEQVIDELSAIAFNNTGFFGTDIKVTADHKLRALDMLAKYLGLYEKDNKQKAPETQVLQIAFVGADAASQAVVKAEEIREAKSEENSVDKNPELLHRTEVLESAIKTVGKKTLDLAKLRGENILKQEEKKQKKSKKDENP